MDLVKANSELPEKIKQELIEKGVEDIAVGQLYIRSQYNVEIIRIREIEYHHDVLTIYYDHTTNWEGTKWSSYGSSSIETWNRENHQRLTKSIAEHVEDAQKVINGEISMAEFKAEEGEEINEETALIGRSSKEGLLAIKSDMEAKKAKVELIAAFVGYEMQKKKAALDLIKSNLEGILKVWQKKISKIMKVIDTIELYLGVNEEIFQIQDGEKASPTTPISFRQLVLFMDEEVANTDDGGLDYNDVHKFDAWLLENGNYKNILPEEKGVVVFRPRRHSKDYGEDSIETYLMNKENKLNTYLLIRNGDCLYRIYTDKIVILDRLFPRKQELQELLKETDKIKKESGSYGEEKAQDKVDNLFYSYKRRAILMQGLIDRTDILHPLPIEGLSMFNLEGSEDYIKFIYDDEAALTDGRLPFKEWQKVINEEIKPGSRIVITPNWRYGDNKYMVEKRGFKYYSNDYSIPKPPSTGLYEVEKYQEIFIQKVRRGEQSDFLEKIKAEGYVFKEKHPTYTYYDNYIRKGTEIHSVIKYNPGDTIYGGWNTDSHERKNRIAFRIFKKDDFILNYDQISLDDINYYLQDRASRKYYLNMMPLLRTMKKWRLEEIENEKYFAKLVLGQLMTLYPKLPESTLTKSIDELIEWWKFKNMIKRPIDKDDTKALRMILAEFKRRNK